MVIAMINGKQIRAARALLEWDAKDLATKANLSLDTVFKIETGSVQPRPVTEEKIANVFNENGIEFLGSHGVQWIQHRIKTLAGAEGLKSFFDDMRAMAKKTGSGIAACGFHEEYFKKKLGDYVKYHRDEMATIKRGGLRCLIEEGDTNFGASAFGSYRWLHKEYYTRVPFYVFGAKLAIIDESASENPLITVIENPAIAQAYRRQFNALWERASVPTNQQVKK